MSTRVVERVEEWSGRSFDGGYRELQDLAAREFSGIVRAGGAELYMTKGTVVGVRHGSIESFEDGGGTAYEAPTPALPLLAVMQERSEEVRGQYYTEETPISEVDRTLSDGGFTGFVELSENVLSGDYYLVYHQGRSMSVAFVGNAARLLHGEEAFERADGEVGIYEVRPATVEAIEIPEPAAPEEAADGTASEAADAGGDQPESQAEDEPDANEESTAAADDSDTEPGPAEGADRSRDDSEATAAGAGAGADQPPAAETVTDEGAAEDAGDESPTTEPAGTPERTAATGQESEPETATATSGDAATGERAGGEASPAGPASKSTTSDPVGSAGGTQAPGDGTAGQTSREAPEPSATGDVVDLETKAIPSLDPQRTSEGSANARADAGPTRVEESGTTRQPEQTETGQSNQGATDQGPARQQSASQQPEPAPEQEQSERVETLESKLSERAEEIQRLEGKLEAAESEREQLEAELETVREERDELEAEVERLRDQQEQLEREFGAATDAERRMTPQEALDGTDIFLRHQSKGDATLEKAHEGSTRRTEVHENLRLEKHTQFDADAVSVGGQTYDQFLEGTIQYQFVKWVARELLFEIRDTGQADGLRNLYDALPKIDRAELNGAVSVTYTEDGQETRSQESFDVVLRDRMGDPLVAANINDSREAATEGMMERLITAAERVGATGEDFSAAFLVTRSFFEPAALETASEATRGGLLSRDKRRSFVNLSRKRGYHLCLVEARNENFHLAVPEL